MRDLARRAMQAARDRGASYADARVVRTETQSLIVKNGIHEAVTTADDLGIGIRVLVDGSWGFAGTSRLEQPEVDRIADVAVAIARASALVHQRPVELAPVEVLKTSWRTPVRQDPWDVSLEEKLNLLTTATTTMAKVKGVRVASGSMEFWKTTKLFMSTEGADIEQVIAESGAGIGATAVGEGEVQRRTYPASDRGHYATGGYEIVTALNLADHAEQTADEAVQLLHAPLCPAMTTDLILDFDQVMLQIHESIGHAVEFDRILGTEAAYAGTSWVEPAHIGSLRYGSEKLNIVADATLPGGLGTFGYDDEGVPAQRAMIIDHGTLVGVLTSRETATVLGQRSNGTARASAWNRIPLIRMTNIGLLPGEGTLAEMIADTQDGIYMSTNKSWSIDDKRLNFQFGCEIAWEVKRGRLGRIFRQPTYWGMTPQFWGALDWVAGPSEWKIGGTPNCGKGQPPQTGHTGHPAAPCRFRGIQVGVR
jgi:TldD protein